MTSHRLFLTLRAAIFLVVGFLSLGQAPALSAECVVCERNFADCRAPAQTKMTSCLNGQQSDCSAKCSDNCKKDTEAQKCMLNCAKSCQSGAGTCRATFASANTQCTNTFLTCKKGCTVTR